MDGDSSVRFDGAHAGSGVVMSTTDDRTAVQAKLQVDMLETENANEHTRIEKMVAAGFKTTDKRIDRLASRMGLAGLAVTLATILGPAWTAISTSQAKGEIQQQAAETTRQSFDKLAESWKSEHKAECRSRDADLAWIADRAAEKAVKAVTIPQEVIKP